MREVFGKRAGGEVLLGNGSTTFVSFAASLPPTVDPPVTEITDGSAGSAVGAHRAFPFTTELAEMTIAGPPRALLPISAFPPATASSKLVPDNTTWLSPKAA